MGCHGGGRDPVERGASHAFVATEALCAPCHEEGAAVARGRELTTSLHRRARELESRLLRAGAIRRAPADPDDPPHAGQTTIVEPASPLGRAAWNVLLVLEDGAAGAHGPVHAAALLDEAEAALR